MPNGRQLSRAVFAMPVGIRYCVTHRDIRRLSLWPWLIGLFVYALTLWAALRVHASLFLWAAPAEGHWWSTPLSWVVWLAVSAATLVVSSLAAVCVMLIATSAFQSAIAAHVLTHLGRPAPAGPDGIGANLADAARSSMAQIIKTVWLVPFFLAALIISFIPILLPLGIVLSAWLLAFQFVDIVLELFRIRPGARVRFALQHLLELILFGAVLAFLWAVPLLGILLTPAAAAAAAWLLADESLYDSVQRSSRRE